MNDPSQEKAEDAPLNPALKSRSETVYDTSRSTPSPFDTTSAKEGEGESWPWVWVVVTVVCVALTIWFLV